MNAHDHPKGTVIVVEDDADTRDSLANLIRSAGHLYRGYASAESFFGDRPAIRAEQLLKCIERALLHSRDDGHRKQRLQRDRKRLASLTRREREVLSLLIQGKLNKEVAHTLHISARTVEGHRIHIMKKLQARTMADLARIWWHTQGQLTRAHG